MKKKEKKKNSLSLQIICRLRSSNSFCTPEYYITRSFTAFLYRSVYFCQINAFSVQSFGRDNHIVRCLQPSEIYTCAFTRIERDQTGKRFASVFRDNRGLNIIKTPLQTFDEIKSYKNAQNNYLAPAVPSSVGFPDVIPLKHYNNTASAVQMLFTGRHGKQYNVDGVGSPVISCNVRLRE